MPGLGGSQSTSVLTSTDTRQRYPFLAINSRANWLKESADRAIVAPSPILMDSLVDDLLFVFCSSFGRAVDLVTGSGICDDLIHKLF